MAQLIKLADYVTRYEIDIYRYPSRYVRLKKERWQRLMQDWETKQKGDSDLPLWNVYENEEKTFLQKSWEKLVKRGKSDIQEEMELPSKEELEHQTLEEVKEVFHEELFKFQLNWASSTVSEKSDVKRSYFFDSFLQFLVKKLPDSFFIFYEPVFLLKKAPVDLDVIILTPSEIWLVKPLLGNQNTIFQTESDRFWIKKDRNSEVKLLHPVISLKRMRTVAEAILEESNLDFPMKQAIIAKNSFIDIPQSNQRVKIIDKRNFDEFHKLLLKNKSPLKHTQLKVADTFLIHTMTTSKTRFDSDSTDTAEDIDTYIEKD